MSGSSGSRDDSGGGSAVGGGDGVDPCARARRGPINSPQAAVLTPLSVGSVLQVIVDNRGPAPILALQNAAGQRAGSLTFNGYLTLIDCIRNRGYTYQATIMAINGGIYEVRVEVV